MKMYEKLKLHIKNNGWTYTFVANRADYNLNKLSRQLMGKQVITIDEYEQICKGMLVDPSFFYKKQFQDRKNISA